MIVLIAPENDIPNEIEILHQLFEAGLGHYHFRKPYKNYEEHCKYLHQIDIKYHSRIVVHYFHELINEFNLKGIHFQEQKRRDVLENGNGYFNTLNMTGKTMSSSFHEYEELENCELEFDYYLLSPVFSSISKQGYKGRGFDVTHSSKKIIGMGGINASTIKKTLALGFKGVGVLGGVWNSENCLDSFLEIKQRYELANNEK